jgi:recombinational DNA repair protein RecT
MNLVQLLEYPEFRNHYILMYNQCHKSVDGLMHFERETTFLKKIAIDNKKIMKATALSVMTALLDLAFHGLSIEPITKPQAYITVRAHNAGTKEQPAWEERAILNITGYGEIAMRIRSGIIRYVDNPVLVFKDDLFEQNKGKVTTHMPSNTSTTITHAYLRIVRYDGSEDYKILSMDDLQAMRAKSDNQNGAAWTGGIKDDDGKPQPMAGMIFAKLFKHSFNGYPRLILGQSTQLADEEIEREAVYANVMSQITDQPTPSITSNESTNQHQEDDENPLGGGETPSPVETKSPPESKSEPKETPKEKATPPVQNNGQAVLPKSEDIPTYEF